MPTIEIDPVLEGFEQIDARDSGAARVLFFKLLYRLSSRLCAPRARPG